MFLLPNFAGCDRSDRPGSVGNTVLRNLVGGYKGRRYPVNPARTEIYGLPCHASIRTVPEAVDLIYDLMVSTGLEAPETTWYALE